MSRRGRRSGRAGALLSMICGVTPVIVLAIALHGQLPLIGDSGTTAAPAAITAPGAPAAPAAAAARTGGLPATTPDVSPWSVFTQGGGPAVAATWAKDLLSTLGLPTSGPDLRFIYDWEVSEGSGGRYNPLNQGPVPGQPALTSTGQQYGGGAADYVSWAAGIAGSAAYLNMPNYAGVLAALQHGSYSQAAAELFRSPWAKYHYGGGASWSAAQLPTR